MTDIVSRMISTQTLLFLYMLTGVFVSKLKIITDENRGVLVRLLMDITMPLMVLNAYNKQTTIEELKASLLIIILATAGCMITFFIGLVLWRKQPANRKSVLMFASMFTNAGNAGLPVVNLVFGPTGVFLASMYLIPPRILQWTLGVSFFVKPDRKSFVKKVLLNPMVIVSYIGFVLIATNWQIPGVFGTAIKNIGDITAPLSMILIGATLSNMKLSALLDKSVLVISALRLLIFPLGFALLIKPLNLDPMAATICVTLLAMPVASNTATIAERYDGDYVFASACISVSTLLSVVTVPVITWLIQMM